MYTRDKHKKSLPTAEHREPFASDNAKAAQILANPLTSFAEVDEFLKSRRLSTIRWLTDLAANGATLKNVGADVIVLINDIALHYEATVKALTGGQRGE